MEKYVKKKKKSKQTMENETENARFSIKALYSIINIFC